MRTPVITIFVVCVLVIGLALAFYDYKKRGSHTDRPNFSKSEGDSLRRTKEVGDEEFQKENYKGAIRQYQHALQMWPRDANIYNDLGASYYRLGLQYMDTPMAEDEFDFGIEVDARIEGSRPLEMVRGKLKETKSGIITVVVDKETDKTEVENYVRSRGEYVHVEVEDLEDNEKEYWLTIVTGKTKEEFLKAEIAYLDAINIRSVKDDSGRKYSTYPTASRNLGTLYFRMGRKKEAIAHWRRVLQLEPTDAELRELISKYE